MIVATVFLASLLGSLHCAGMCGAFVAFAVGLDGRAAATPAWALQSAYHAGRLAVYVTLGALAGAVGGAFDLAGETVGLQRVAVIMAGSLMVLFGGITLLRVWGVRLGQPPVPRVLREAVSRFMRFAAERTPVARALLTGLATTLLPCGWLYAFVISASGTGQAWDGALVMGVFWLGTLPVLMAVGAGARALTAGLGALGRQVPAIAASLVIASGCLAIANRGSIDSAAMAAALRHKDGGAATSLATVDPGQLPCCVHHASTP